MSNRLGTASSPYLRQHADNPVHWWEWCDEAFAEARDRDVPVLLSVGYSTCHWCHVMAHESFEDEAIAAQMNAGFVCIKVDREERPDLDAIYMNATVAMTGQGGWPMTCFLTPSGEPFYCGTYYPPASRGGMPGFDQILGAITETWTERRDEVLDASGRVTEHLQAVAGAVPAGPPVDAALLGAAVDMVLADEDPRSSGFGGAPKFPPGALLEALLRAGELASTGSTSGSPLAAVTRTCSAMARGGIYDQLAGGFARYSVDSAWVVPHFEKMLYDNALLLRFYAHLVRVLSAGSRSVTEPGSPVLELVERITTETVDFLDRKLWTGHGYASSLDADTDGVEGLTYVWTPAQLRDVLGDDDGEWAAALFRVTETGTQRFEEGASTLQLLRDPAARILQSMGPAGLGLRPQPDRDDKVVAVWNALTITALAEAGVALGRPEWVARAAETAEQLWSIHVVDGGLRRVSLGGDVGEPLAALDDHAAFVTALLTLHQVTGDVLWRDRALQLLDTAIDLFVDPDAPGAWFDAQASDGLITRPRDPIDGATPSGVALLAEALLLASTLAPGDAWSRYAELADTTLGRGTLIIAKAPRSAGHWMAVAQARLAGPIQVAVAQTEGTDGALAETARRVAPGGAVVVAGEKDSLPLLDGRGPVDGVDAAYICRGRTCDLPIVDASGLVDALGVDR